jgi:hypothetical protein
MMTNRIGTFLILLGIVLLALFAYSDIVQAPVCNLLISGGLSLGLGIFLWFRNPAPPPPETGRFRLFRSASKKQNKKNDQA